MDVAPVAFVTEINPTPWCNDWTRDTVCVNDKTRRLAWSWCLADVTKYPAAPRPAWSEGDRVLHHLPRRWPKPGPRALAIAAMALVSAAVLPAMTITAAASPTPATTTVAKLSPDAGSRQVLMLNGDRLLVRPARDGALTTLLPARFGKAVLTLHIARTIYHIPVDALPYIGHGLDPSLFNLASLERAESAGRLPVQVSFAGAQRPLPGIKITSRDGRTAAGYLTTSSAKVFGAALYRQFIVDHATAGYANSPLFA